MCCRGPYLLVLLLGQLNEDLARRVLNIKKRQNSSAIVRHSHILSDVRSCSQALRGLSFPYPYVIHHHLVQTGRTEGGFDDISDGLCCQNCKESVIHPQEREIHQ